MTETYVTIDGGCTAQKHAKKSALDEFLGETEEDNPDDRQDNIQEEIKRYTKERLASQNSDPLDWWELNEFRFHHIACIAKSILAVPATSTSKERLFSTAGLTVTRLRNSLKPENVNALVFLKKF